MSSLRQLHPAVPPVFSGLLLLLVAGCGERTPAPEASAPAAHHHAPQHGGVLVELGQEEFHLEFTYGDAPGVVQAYVWDGEVENYVRVDLPSFAATGRSGGRDLTLLFQATTNSATGEKVGDSALFEANTGLAGKPALTLTVPVYTMKGRTYRDLTVALPAAKVP